MAGKSTKAARKSSSIDPPVLGELSNLEVEFQAHREATAARFEEMQASFQKSLDANLLSYQGMLAEQFQKLFGNHLVLTTSGAAAIIQPDGSVRFGSVPAPTHGLLPMSESSSYIVLVRYEGKTLLGAGVSTVMVSGANSSVDMSTVLGAKGGSGIAGFQHIDRSQPQMGVSSSVLGAPPSLGLTQSFPLYHTHGVPNVVHNSHDMFSMNYSGPYTASGTNFSSSFPSCSSTPYIHQHTFVTTIAARNFSIDPTFATTITSHPLSPKASINTSSQSYFQIPPTQNQYHSYNSSQSYLDPNLPTMKQMRLDFGNYGGGDPVEWLNKCEQFFEFYQIPEERKLSIASMYLTDKASDRWYMFRHEFPPTWQGLADLLMREFSSYNRAACHAALARMNQTGSVEQVEQFMEQFTKLSRRTPGISQEVLVYFFIGGLREDIRADVQAFKPRSLYEACELARVYETRNWNLRHASRYNMAPRTEGSHPVTHIKPPISSMAKVSTGASYQGRNVQAVPSSNSNIKFKLTDSEFEARRARKQRYFCDSPYVPGHNYRKKGQLMSLEIVPDEDELMMLDSSESQREVPPITDLDEPLIRLQVMGDDSATTETMQLKGRLGNKSVHVLIDFGATHNFIHPQLLKGTKFPVQYFSPLNVRLASGAKMKTRGEVHAQLSLQDFNFAADFYILPVTGCEIELGAGWLKSLGDILWNFETMRMKFKVSELEYMLQGIVAPSASVISCKAMTRLLKKEKEAMLVQVQSLTTIEPAQSPPKDIQVLFDKYAALFEVPTSLPPARKQDHTIELLPNTPPVSVRPYRYPHFQKTEIEKIVQELLDNGVIRPSKSPFSSPVLLVKKKDGTWRMCVDYRALNSVTVKDKYPIPVVDELLDEVQGSTIFTKLDLRSGYHQIQMSVSDVSKTAFRTHNGHYDPDLPSHLEHLEMIFRQLQQHKLKVKQSKCSFGVRQVEYLGHVISAKGVSVDPKKVECIRTWEKPKTVKGLRGFLGLAGYYRKYVKNFGIIAKPLTDMLRIGGFQWSPLAEIAFEELKHALMTTPVLAFLILLNSL
ncbi:PREDICTED: uncharacterized protein LOC101313866 [Fragaria vesca subsp. vesca]|uniref:uncharacterized protein LOC101313866 n=1 Tax=Fragaria vesca subsp. vesca TaxID=101020 RepID=UPI0002C33142|nr:PREDICTED: uncharacterized protein LOC101313866 [Fragaria vesca subsp. vesca]